MLLNKTIDSLVLATTKEKENIYALDHVYVTEKEVYASNGRSAYWAAKSNDIGNFPVPDGYTPPEYPLLIPNKAVSKAIANRPKRLPDNSILNNILVGQTDQTVELTTMDLTITDVVKTKVSNQGYPDIDYTRSKCKPDDDGVTVTLGITELELLIKMAKKQKADTVALTVSSEKSPVSVKMENGDNSINGLIMPCVKQC